MMFSVFGRCTELLAAGGGIATGIFGSKALFGARVDVSIFAQLAGTFMAVLFALIVGFLAFGFMKILTGLRLSPHEEFVGSDRAIHNIEAYPEEAL